MKKKNTIATLVVLSFIILLFSCSHSKEDQYLGYWKEDGKDHSEILEIQKEGEKLYVKSLDLESPAAYNKDDKTLSTQLRS
ncbi:hypothetical protein OHD16_15640 [Sphingobacterium sp. ML3W]|uniref:hypothetical protein n=1 Tax=Sphingobacterium sp. ML3W TaxID=1538644 RepID=UPI00249AB6EB|nr:hypothetical protein [Sphingobacterium sp. ML3W]WFA81387.1 hypothetical protein OGI71_08780 [Sphingobacterium sp. ML3W]